MRPDQVVLTLFTFEIFKQCDQMAVAMEVRSDGGGYGQCMFLVKIIKRYIEDGN